MKEFIVKIKPLTPIWTGDADRKNSTLRETGIIGSLRWWYEALIRGLDGNACDPTNTKCDGQNHCDACELFGCTGWARKFRLETSFNYTIPEVWIGTREERNKRYLKRKVDGLMSDGSIELTFIPLKDINKDEWVLLNSTLKVIENYGAIGAHISQGNGVIKIIENNLPYQNEKCKECKGEQFDKSKNSLASLDKFFFYKFKLEFNEDISKLINNKSFWTHAQDDNQFKDSWHNWKKLWENYNFLPIAFHIRDSIRHLENGWETRHDIFGELGKGSKVFVSHGYKINEKNVEFRIWGYGIDSSLLSSIKNNLESNLKQKLFSDGKDLLKNCILKEEKTVY